MSETITPAATSAETATPTTAEAGATLLTAAPAAAPDAAATSAETPAAPPPAPVVPEKYEFKAPDGVTFDPSQVEAFSPVAKELGLTNENAQKLVDFHLAQVSAAQTAQHEAWQNVVKGWADQTRADKEIGGLKFDESVSLARKTIDKFGSRELSQALDTSGMGNHPAVVKFFVSVGKQLAEDAMLNGNAAQGGKSVAETLFPSMFPPK